MLLLNASCDVVWALILFFFLACKDGSSFSGQIAWPLTIPERGASKSPPQTITWDVNMKSDKIIKMFPNIIMLLLPLLLACLGFISEPQASAFQLCHQNLSFVGCLQPLVLMLHKTPRTPNRCDKTFRNSAGCTQNWFVWGVETVWCMFCLFSCNGSQK